MSLPSLFNDASQSDSIGNPEPMKVGQPIHLIEEPEIHRDPLIIRAFVVSFFLFGVGCLAYGVSSGLQRIPPLTFALILLAVSLFAVHAGNLLSLWKIAGKDIEDLSSVRKTAGGLVLNPISAQGLARTLRVGSVAQRWILGLAASSSLDRPDLQAVGQAATLGQPRPKQAGNVFLLISLMATILGLFEVIRGLDGVLFSNAQSPDETKRQISYALPKMATAFLGTAAGILLSVLYSSLANAVFRRMEDLEAAVERFAVLELAPGLLPKAPSKILETLDASIASVNRSQAAVEQYQISISSQLNELQNGTERLGTTVSQSHESAKTAIETSVSDLIASLGIAMKDGHKLLKQTDDAMQKSGIRLEEAIAKSIEHAATVVSVLGRTAEGLQRVLVDNIGPTSDEFKFAAERIYSSVATIEKSIVGVQNAVGALANNASRLDGSVQKMGSTESAIRSMEGELEKAVKALSQAALELQRLPDRQAHTNLVQSLQNAAATFDVTNLNQSINRLENTVRQSADLRRN